MIGLAKRQNHFVVALLFLLCLSPLFNGNVRTHVQKDVSKKMSTLLTRSANRALRDTRLSNQDHLAQSPSVSLEQTLETSNLTMMGSSKQVPTSAINPSDPKRVPSTRSKNSSTRIHERGKKRFVFSWSLRFSLWLPFLFVSLCIS